jgi:hypothetical protein
MYGTFQSNSGTRSTLQVVRKDRASQSLALRSRLQFTQHDTPTAPW